MAEHIPYGSDGPFSPERWDVRRSDFPPVAAFKADIVRTVNRNIVGPWVRVRIAFTLNDRSPMSVRNKYKEHESEREGMEGVDLRYAFARVQKTQLLREASDNRYSLSALAALWLSGQLHSRRWDVDHFERIYEMSFMESVS